MMQYILCLLGYDIIEYNAENRRAGDPNPEGCAGSGGPGLPRSSQHYYISDAPAEMESEGFTDATDPYSLLTALHMRECCNMTTFGSSSRIGILEMRIKTQYEDYYVEELRDGTPRQIHIQGKCLYT